MIFLKFPPFQEYLIQNTIARTRDRFHDSKILSFDMDKNDKTAMATGTGSSQSDLIYADSRTLTASSTENLDLAGSLTDALGNTLTFVNVKSIYIKADSGNTNNVEVTPEATNGFVGCFNALTDQVDIPPSGSFLVTAPVSGWAVTASTGDLLTITNSAGATSVTYEIVIIGTSA